MSNSLNAILSLRRDLSPGSCLTAIPACEACRRPNGSPPGVVSPCEVAVQTSLTLEPPGGGRCPKWHASETPGAVLLFSAVNLSIHTVTPEWALRARRGLERAAARGVLQSPHEWQTFQRGARLIRDPHAVRSTLSQYPSFSCSARPDSTVHPGAQPSEVELKREPDRALPQPLGLFVLDAVLLSK